jgi:hypothetical protein
MRFASLLQVSFRRLYDLQHADREALGAVGVLGYASVGIYKEIRNIKFADDKEKCPAELVRKIGEEEYANATESDKLYVVRVWCQTMMHVRLV